MRLADSSRARRGRDRPARLPLFEQEAKEDEDETDGDDEATTLGLTAKNLHRH
jgi:hypothetical protein